MFNTFLHQFREASSGGEIGNVAWGSLLGFVSSYPLSLQKSLQLISKLGNLILHLVYKYAGCGDWFQDQPLVCSPRNCSTSVTCPVNILSWIIQWIDLPKHYGYKLPIRFCRMTSSGNELIYLKYVYLHPQYTSGWRYYNQNRLLNQSYTVHCRQFSPNSAQ